MDRWRLGIALVVTATLVWACAEPAATTDEAAIPTTASTLAPTTSVVTTTTTTTVSAHETTTTLRGPPDHVTTIELPESIVLWVYDGEPTSIAFRGNEMLFHLTQSCGECFAMDKKMTREPNGVLSAEGWQGGVWTVVDAGQIEINRLWPPNSPRNMDVLWLTDYTGVTTDTLTGFTPEPAETFTLYDEIALEPQSGYKGLFGLHADCRTEDDQIAAALLSFENEIPAPVIGWIIDYNQMTFVTVDEPTSLSLGGCLPPEPRP